METETEKPLTRLQRMRLRFEREGDTETEKKRPHLPKLTEKRKKEEDPVSERDESSRKTRRLVTGEAEIQNIEKQDSLAEEKPSGQKKLTSNPHLFNYSKLGQEGHRGGGLRGAGGVWGGPQGVKGREGRAKPALTAQSEWGNARAKFQPSQSHLGRDSATTQYLKKAVIGSTAACEAACSNREPEHCQLGD